MVGNIVDCWESEHYKNTYVCTVNMNDNRILTIISVLLEKISTSLTEQEYNKCNEYIQKGMCNKYCEMLQQGKCGGK